MQSGITAVFQQFRQACCGYRLRVVFATLVWAVLSSAPAAADYLSDLESEAEATASVADKDAAGITPASGGGAIGASGLTGGNGRKQFERALKAERPNIHTFYERLQEADKVRVVEYYKASSEKMPKTVNLILDLYFKKE